MKFTFILILLTIGLANASTHIKKLLNAETSKISDIITDNTIVIVFQSNCSACRYQVKSIDCLKNKANVILLGAFTKESDLRREYHKFETTYPAYYAGEDVLRTLGIKVKATPQILIFNKGVVQTYLGIRECQKLEDLIQKQTS